MSPRAVLPLAGLVVVAAGCGGSKSPSVASLGTTTRNASAKPLVPNGGSFLSFVHCMTRHGVPMTTGPGGRGANILGNPAGSQLNRAQQACQKLLPGGGPPALTPAQQAQREQDLYALAKCIRKHGVPNFPAPTTDGELAPGSANAPGFERALAACGSTIRNMHGARMFR